MKTNHALTIAALTIAAVAGALLMLGSMPTASTKPAHSAPRHHSSPVATNTPEPIVAPALTPIQNCIAYLMRFDINGQYDGSRAGLICIQMHDTMPEAKFDSIYPPEVTP
jgi:hypothetical protein